MILIPREKPRAYNEAVMRSGLILPLLLTFASAGASAQQVDTSQPTLSVRSTLVEVPALVKTKAGEVVFELTADDFVLTDDGVPFAWRRAGPEPVTWRTIESWMRLSTHWPGTWNTVSL
jgi:hypothetical protein